METDVAVKLGKGRGSAPSQHKSAIQQLRSKLACEWPAVVAEEADAVAGGFVHFYAESDVDADADNDLDEMYAFGEDAAVVIDIADAPQHEPIVHNDNAQQVRVVTTVKNTFLNLVCVVDDTKRWHCGDRNLRSRCTEYGGSSTGKKVKGPAKSKRPSQVTSSLLQRRLSQQGRLSQ